MHRLTLLGWAWPVVRQLAQLGVLVFVFSTILPLGIPDFPVFVFSGLIGGMFLQANGGGTVTINGPGVLSIDPTGGPVQGFLVNGGSQTLTINASLGGTGGGPMVPNLKTNPVASRAPVNSDLAFWPALNRPYWKSAWIRRKSTRGVMPT